MPSKYTIKEYAPQSYYHIFNRGVEKRKIFQDDSDYEYFLCILKRHLSNEIIVDKSLRPYEKFNEGIELLAYCLMPNHFHMFVYQLDDERTMSNLLRSVCTAYSMYFNKKYKRVGLLFQGRFKGSLITTDSYLSHISRYIHMNPKDYLNYNWSSLSEYLSKRDTDWIQSGSILELFGEESYLEFLKDYAGEKEIWDEIKNMLAHA